MRDISEVIQVMLAAAFIFVVVFIITSLVFDVNKNTEATTSKDITQEWIDEQTRCFYQNNRAINCETVLP